MSEMMNRSAVLIVSGGLDSCVLAHYYASAGFNLHLLSFDYGQKHIKELIYAEKYITNLRERYGQGSHAITITHDVVELPISRLSPDSDSALLNPDVAVPYGHYSDDSMKVTVVPYRNPNMLLQAATLAWNKHASVVAYAAHYGDYAQYPDCREVFVDAFNNMLATAMVGQTIRVEAPFMYFSKAQIVRLGSNLQVPFELTWSCYEGNELQCGLCGTCFERRVAMREAGVADPTIYMYGMPSYEDPNG